jgi:hypothetical protein
MKLLSEKTLFGHAADYLANVPEPGEIILKPEALNDYYRVNNNITRVRNSAARSIRKMRRRQRQSVIAQQEKLNAQNALTLQQLTRDNETERKKLVTETVQWMVEESDLEQQLYATAMLKAQQWTIEALQQWGIGANWDEPLYVRVKEMIRQFEKEPDLVLALPCEALAKTFSQRLADSPENNRCHVNVVVDPALTACQAKLSNSLVSVLLDMNAELDDILAQLRSQPVANTLPVAECYE